MKEKFENVLLEVSEQNWPNVGHARSRRTKQARDLEY